MGGSEIFFSIPPPDLHFAHLVLVIV